MKRAHVIVLASFAALGCSRSHTAPDAGMDVIDAAPEPTHSIDAAACVPCGDGSCAPPGETCPVCDEDEWWPDADGDGVGAGDGSLACERPAGFAPATGDCDDTDPAVGALVDDAFEENDSIETAAPLELARYELRTCAVASTVDDRDADYYELPSAGPFAQRYLRLDIDPDVDVSVMELDASGAMVGYVDTAGTGFLGAVVHPEAVYIGIERWVSTSPPCTCTSYDLEIATRILW